ncbi:MAG TPA: alpha/beta fold hydrolase [Chitinophagaceae bacterium]|nr:alpha/beta fold hydrolase [Chitinophagaceae bacterium]
MKKATIKRSWKIFRIVFLIYIVLGMALYFLQDKIIFRPKKLAENFRFQFDIPFREINLPVSENKNLNIIQFTVPDSLCKGVVLYFHGNRSNVIRYAPFASNFTRMGYAVWMMDYPGFGKSTGKRTEQGLYDDALTLYKMAISQYAADSIILYGKSLGTGIAAQLASIRDCRRLILETPYYSMHALVKHYFFIYPTMPFTKYTLPTHKYFEFVNAPITIFHGTRDGVIPYKQARQLQEVKPGIELITIDKGRHNNLTRFPLFIQKLDSVLSH